MRPAAATRVWAWGAQRGEEAMASRGCANQKLLDRKRGALRWGFQGCGKGSEIRLNPVMSVTCPSRIIVSLTFVSIVTSPSVTFCTLKKTTVNRIDFFFRRYVQNFRIPEYSLSMRLRKRRTMLADVFRAGAVDLDESRPHELLFEMGKPWCRLTSICNSIQRVCRPSELGSLDSVIRVVVQRAEALDNVVRSEWIPRRSVPARMSIIIH